MPYYRTNPAVDAVSAGGLGFLAGMIVGASLLTLWLLGVESPAEGSPWLPASVEIARPPLPTSSSALLAIPGMCSGTLISVAP